MPSLVGDPVPALPPIRQPSYRFALHDLLTRAELVEHMPFTLDEYTRALTEAGSTSASLNLADERNLKFDPWANTLPRRTTLVVLRDEVVVAEYIVWQRPPYQPSEQQLHIGASEIRSYFDHRLLRPTTGPGSAKTLTYTQVDQFDIFRALLADCQAVTFEGQPVGDIGVEADPSVLSGVLRDRRDVADTADAYHGYTFDTYGDLMSALADLDNGFEWRIDSYLDESRTLRRALRLGYPTVGHPATDDAVTLEYPGVVDDYEWPEDGSASANYVATIGAGEEAAIKWSEAYAAPELRAGWPLLERTTSYKSVTVQSTLDGHAIADVAALSGDIVVPSLTVFGRPPIEPGDYVRVRIADEARFRGSSVTPFETYMRAVQVSTTVGPPEKTTIAVEAPRTPGES